jgi:cell migration-inducing and hyaluronan-binding protein
MTRWIVLHSTQGVLLQRNVGYKSIGNGFFLENGTETDNKFYSNLGIFARAAVANPQNPRQVPGILADSQALWAPQFMPVNPANPGFPFRADAEYPTAFWITNGWNDFVGNMAAGTGACGSGYWFVPTINNDMADVPTDANSDVETVRPNVTFKHMRWTDKDGKLGYAGLQRNTTFEASTPLRVFYGNSSTATMMSFQTTTDAPACAGAGFQPADTVKYPATPNQPTILEIQSFAPPPNRITPPNAPNQADTIFPGMYYPRTHGLRAATLCGASGDCSAVKNRCSAADGTNCTVTVLDHFTSSFTWAQGNVSAIWLRPQWYLLTNSVITDVQNGGVTFITGGDFTHSAVIPGYWALMLDSILVGHTQLQDDAHEYTRDQGPVNTASGLTCKAVDKGESNPGYCVLPNEGVSFPVVSYFVNQRLSNIYDGPSYQDSNIYLDITPTKCVSDTYNGPGHCIYGSGNAAGLPKDPVDGSCYLPNAAIGWKQPNGFFYPPAFHSTNLFFGNVGIRHYVIKPIFKASADLDPKFDFGQGGTYITTSLTNLDLVYCNPHPEDMFNGFTSIDRQTELNDADGTLTGLSNVQPDKTLPPVAPLFPVALKQTISVNEDAFFTAPVETPECASNDGNKPTSAANVLPANACKSPSTKASPVTAKTSPYDYVATVVFHQVDPAKNWDSVCSSPQCYGVPLYRQYLAGDNTTEKTREWAHWHELGCDSPPNTASLNNPKCRWPFIRMAGEDTLGTRETLTVNNGLYYLDTAVPEKMQKDIYKREPMKEPVLISSGENYNQQAGPHKSLDNAGNVFQPKETYFVFFLYAKNTTRQTYQIYVGKDPKGGSVKPARVEIPNTTLIAKSEDAAQPWVIPDTSTVMTDGIVSVTIDFTKLPKDPTTKLTELDPVPANGLCRPSKFCTANGVKCDTKLASTDPAVVINPFLKANAERACSTWAVKDLDCPLKGCLGFSFTLPDETIFKADATVANPTPHRRQPIVFGEDTDKTAQGLPNWFVKFSGTAVDPDHTAGQCHYTKLPSYVDSSTECLTPDWVPQAPK